MKRYSLALATLLSSGLTLCSPRPSASQALVPGLRIRSKAAPSDEWRTGTLVRFGRDSLVMQRCRECAPEAQPWAGLTRVEVSEGKTLSGRNAVIGAVVGGVVATLIEKRRVDRDVARCRDGPCGLESLAIPVVGVLGAAGGAFLGALWRVESWREVYGEDPAHR